MTSTSVYWMGFKKEEKKEMKKKYNDLSKTEQEKIELEYHQMDPSDLDLLMPQANSSQTTSIRLSGEMVESLKVIAELEGERGYQSMVRRWITERMQQEAKIALRLSDMPLEKVVSVLEKQFPK